MRRVVPALGLALLAPLVGEYLLGNVAIRDLVALPFLVPMYGGGALLVRELTRRAGCGWPTVLLLGAAYGLIEAGIFDGSLFSPSYDGLDFTSAYVPALGISAYNAPHFVIGHAVWSIAVPILFVEALAGERRSTPWLGNVGLAVTAAGYLLGGYIIHRDSVERGDYRTSAAQLAAAAILAAVLVALAFLCRPSGNVTGRGTAPRPLLVGVAAFIVAGAFTVAPEDWSGVVMSIGLLALAGLGIARLSRRTGFGDGHRIALAGGALLTYAWVGFVVSDLHGYTGAAEVIGKLVLDAGALLLIAVAMRRAPRPGG